MAAVFITNLNTVAAVTRDFSPYQHKISAGLIDKVSQNNPTRVIVRYHDAIIESDIQNLESSRPRDREAKAENIAFKAQRYGELKARITTKLNRNRYKVVDDYSHLPMNVLTLKGEDDLLELLAEPTVAEVYPDIELQHFLTQSKPLIHATDVANHTSYSGANSMVVVLDTGVNYTLADFGSCTAPGQPAGCRVVVAGDLVTQDNSLDADGHGTNVAGIVAGIAPGSKLAVFDVFNGDSAPSSAVIQGINWAIANQLTYNISAISMSLGDLSQNASQCGSRFSNPYVTPIANAYAAGILTVIAAGNSAYSGGLAMPACTPYAVSVGAVYDSNVGGLNWGVCTDSSTAANKVACFSNSANYLSLLAPGALITAAGSTMGGTSQAAPHVAAAISVLQGARPSESAAGTLSRLVSTGVAVTDARNGLTFPRIDLLAALGSVNDNFDTGEVLVGTVNQSLVTLTAKSLTAAASKELDEPNHANNNGGKSVWFDWTSPGTGLVTIDTHGSDFDTLLAVYNGATLNSVVEVASNDNDDSVNGNSSLSFVATSGTLYKIAIDGFAGASGNAILNLKLDTSVGQPVPASPIWSLLLMAIGLIAISLRVKSRQQAV